MGRPRGGVDPPDLAVGVVEAAGRCVSGGLPSDHYLCVANQLQGLFILWDSGLVSVLHQLQCAIESLEVLRVSGTANHYRSLSQMLAFEADNELTTQSLQARRGKLMSGTQALWVIHRCMNFQLQFMKAVHASMLAKKPFKVDDRIKVYMGTLGHTMSPLHQTADKLRLATCAGRQKLLHKMEPCCHSKTSLQLLGEMVTALEPLCQKTADLYLNEQDRQM